MKEPIDLKSDNPMLNFLNFMPYRNMVARHVTPYIPKPNEPQTMEVVTPWGAKLTAKAGDLLVSEIDKPDDKWPIDANIFDETYLVTAPGLCIKRAVTLLVPLTDLTNGDEDQMVTVHTLEGSETVRAGDFLLAKGVRGEIWPFPKAKAEKIMKPVNL